VSHQLYPSDLPRREWKDVKGLIPAAKPGGRKRQTDMRLTIKAIFYINRADGVGDRKTPGRREMLSHVSPTPGGGADIRLKPWFALTAPHDFKKH
jgi:hypothetical protein